MNSWSYEVLDVPEWLFSMTRDHVGPARAGSIPAVRGFEFSLKIIDVFGTTALCGDNGFMYPTLRPLQCQDVL